MAKATAPKKAKATPVKKVAAKKAAVKKVAPKKAAAKKPAAKKVAVKKVPAKKVVAKKAVVKKPAAKKVAPKKEVAKNKLVKKAAKKPTRKPRVKKVVEPDLTITQIELANRAVYATQPATEESVMPIQSVNDRLESPEPIARWRVWLGVFAISLGIFAVWIYSLQFTVLANPVDTAQNEDIDALVDNVSNSYTELEDSVTNIKARYEELDVPDSNATAETNPSLNTDELDQLFSDLQ